jgi:hypothetical protein
LLLNDNFMSRQIGKLFDYKDFSLIRRKRRFGNCALRGASIRHSDRRKLFRRIRPA